MNKPPAPDSALRNCTLCGATVFPTTRVCEFCGNVVEEMEERLPSEPVESKKDIYHFEIIVMGILTLSAIYILVVIARTHPMLYPHFRLGISLAITSFALATAVLLDANGRRGNIGPEGVRGMPLPEQWFVAILFLWPFSLPWYCTVRRPQWGRTYLNLCIAAVLIYVSIVCFSLIILKREIAEFYFRL